MHEKHQKCPLYLLNSVPSHSPPSSSTNANGQLPRKLSHRHQPTRPRYVLDRPALNEAPLLVVVLTILSYAVLIVFGYLRQLLSFLRLKKPPQLHHDSSKHTNFVPLYNDFENFYTRYLYMRGRDCFNRPICGLPGAKTEVMERLSPDYNHTYHYTGKSIECINLASYNYMGFAERGGVCARLVEDSVRDYGLALTSSRLEIGTLQLHEELESLVAEFVGKEDAFVFQMGFATNSMNIPAIAGKGTLLISDSQNHSSLILGSKLSGAKVLVFKHNDMQCLEKMVRNAVIKGQPRTRWPWNKIIILVEGIYSMEGSIVNLPEVIRIKEKYKCYLYLDEAHSIGCLGRTGRGVTEYWNISPARVDLMMGTFTKSFGSAGGYIAASKKFINYLRVRSHNAYYGVSVSPPIIKQTISSMKVLMGKIGGSAGREKINNLAENVVYFRRRLKEMGFIIYGDDHSPVVPLLVYYPAKCIYFSRETLARGLAVVIVGFPATSLYESRVRFCLSSAHTREMLDEVLDIVDELGDKLRLKYKKSFLP